MDRLVAMETFVYVVETGSFSAAARRLKIGQPTESKTIAQLETRVAVPIDSSSKPAKSSFADLMDYKNRRDTASEQ